MAGIINVTVALNGMRTMVKEVPVCPDLQPVTSTTTGYVSATDISFAYVAGACTIASVAASLITTQHFASAAEMILVSSTSGLNDGLYTMASVAEGAITLGATEVLTTETAGHAGTVVIYAVAVYKITPTKKMEQGLIVYSEGLEAGGHVGMIPCILNGDFWAANAGLYTAFAATAVTGTGGTHYLWVETSKFLQADGTILVMLKPIATKELYTWHRPALGFLQLP